MIIMIIKEYQNLSVTLSVTQPLCQGMDLIDNFDIIWSSKWPWPIIFSVGVVFATIELPTYACSISQRWPVLVGPQVFVIAEICICWFGRFVFAKPSLSTHQCLFWMSPKKQFRIFRFHSSTFADICLLFKVKQPLLFALYLDYGRLSKNRP